MSTHDLYVSAAYGLAALGILGLIAWISLDFRGRKAELKQLEEAGVSRRSDQS